MAAQKFLGPKFEQAVQLLANARPPSDENSRKPVLFHNIRVSSYLYERGYPKNTVLASLLHDAIEWYGISESMLRKEFGDTITNIVIACTKDDSIKDPIEKIEKIIQQCVNAGKEALIVKAADVLDSFKWYTSTQNTEELKYCMRNADAIFRLKPDDWQDGVFEQLQKFYKSK